MIVRDGTFDFGQAIGRPVAGTDPRAWVSVRSLDDVDLFGSTEDHGFGIDLFTSLAEGQILETELGIASNRNAICTSVSRRCRR